MHARPHISEIIAGNTAPVGGGFDDISLQGVQDHENKYLNQGDLKNIMNTANSNDISIVYLNIGSLPKHLDELEHFLEKSNCYPSFIALAETAITETANIDFHPHLEGYTYENVKSSTKSGSVGIFIKNELLSCCKIRYDLNMWHSKLFETIWLEVDFNKCRNFIGVIYRHNGSADIPYFSRTLEKT